MWQVIVIDCISDVIAPCLFQTTLMTILFQSAQLILTPQDYPLLTTCFYVGLILLQEMLPNICWSKGGIQHQTVLSLLPLLLSNGN